MGSYTKGILGPFRGKVGTVVGYTWRGKDFMRSLPKARTTIATEKQLVQRAKFKTVIRFLTPIQEVVGAYFGKDQKTKSPFNLATGYHLEEALVAGPNNTWLIDYPKVLISRGNLRGIDTLGMAAGSTGLLKLTWEDNSGQGSATATDQLVVVVYAMEMDEFVLFNPIALRSEGEVTLTFPPYLSGSLAQVWATFITEDGKTAAISSYAGSETIPL